MFKAIQSAFSARIRDPEHAPCPEKLDPERMRIYETLVFNNIEDILANNFPVLKSVLTRDYWEYLVREFLIKHRAKTPLFYEIPQECLVFLDSLEKKPPFLYELAHYEWMELDVELAESELDVVCSEGDVSTGIIIVSPVLRLVSYAFAVHRISVDNIPVVPEDALTYIAIYRDKTHAVRFIVLNVIAARLLALLMNDNRLTGEHAIQLMIKELPHLEPQLVRSGGEALLQEWQEAELLWGITEA